MRPLALVHPLALTGRVRRDRQAPERRHLVAIRPATSASSAAAAAAQLVASRSSRRQTAAVRAAARAAEVRLEDARHDALAAHRHVLRHTRLPLLARVHVHHELRARLLARLRHTDRAAAAGVCREPEHLDAHRRAARHHRPHAALHRPLPARHHQLHIARHLRSHTRRLVLRQQVGLALHCARLCVHVDVGLVDAALSALAHHMEYELDRLRLAPARRRLCGREQPAARLRARALSRQRQLVQLVRATEGALGRRHVRRRQEHDHVCQRNAHTATFHVVKSNDDDDHRPQVARHGGHEWHDHDRRRRHEAGARSLSPLVLVGQRAPLLVHVARVRLVLRHATGQLALSVPRHGAQSRPPRLFPQTYIFKAFAFKLNIKYQAKTKNEKQMQDHLNSEIKVNKLFS